MLALLEGLGGKLGLGLRGDWLGDELEPLSDGLGLAPLTDGLGLAPLTDGLGLLVDGLGLLVDGLGLLVDGLGLLVDGLGLLVDGLGLLVDGLGLAAVRPVVGDTQTVGPGLAVVVRPMAGLVEAVARIGCCGAQLAEFGGR